VVAQSYARIFFRNCISTGELYPVETDVRLCDELATGQDITVDMEKDVLINHTTGKEYSLKPIGEVGGGEDGFEITVGGCGRRGCSEGLCGRRRGGGGGWRAALAAAAPHARGPPPPPAPPPASHAHRPLSSLLPPSCPGGPRDRRRRHLRVRPESRHDQDRRGLKSLRRCLLGSLCIVACKSPVPGRSASQREAFGPGLYIILNLPQLAPIGCRLRVAAAGAAAAHLRLE
jgi:hypothetical protein